ncbi:hypothetical protein AVE30378_02540 [Achromobacter veterisilvae]|uniref:DUF1376 domain-containing protein n=1 Tax=Achromobacter veterisilvae TaxID=2069367 RepID=A0A446CH95_9BURK|nr:DUF1376 domain-containing protein [Achromobacter veterisilvae]SSW67276.1 hypothetical protein AVE30378_02540 [Achromobacter veterisilvae]
MTNPAPYPADTRAKGWRFELDHERIRQSDTWALAAPEIRPWLLMLWMTAWEQTPCGSLPQDDELIAARIGMPLDQFQAAKARLLRGWWLADDGRLYHDTLAERVLEMIERRDGERNRKAEYRERKKAERAANQADKRPNPSHGGPDLSHGTGAGLPGDSGGSDATGTGTGTSNTKEIAAAAIHPPARDPVDNSPPPSEAQWLAAQEECAAGYAKLLNSLEQVRGKRSKFVSTDTRLVAWERLGLTREKLVEAYHLAVAEREAAEDPSPVNAGFLDVFVAKVLNPPEGESVAGARPATGAGAADPLAWATTASGIAAKGAELGIVQDEGEPFPAFKLRVHAAANLSEQDRARLRADFGVHA